MNPESLRYCNTGLFGQHGNNGHVMDGVTGKEHQLPLHGGDHKSTLVIGHMLHSQGSVCGAVSHLNKDVTNTEKLPPGRVVIPLEDCLTLAILVVQGCCGRVADRPDQCLVVVDNVAYVFAYDVLFSGTERPSVKPARQYLKQIRQLVNSVDILGDQSVNDSDRSGRWV